MGSEMCIRDRYGPFVVYENGKKVLYVIVLRALYGMLISAMLWYNKFRGDLEGIGFEFNPYDSRCRPESGVQTRIPPCRNMNSKSEKI